MGREGEGGEGVCTRIRSAVSSVPDRGFVNGGVRANPLAFSASTARIGRDRVCKRSTGFFDLRRGEATHIRGLRRVAALPHAHSALAVECCWPWPWMVAGRA